MTIKTQVAPFVFPWFQVISTMVLMAMSGATGYWVKARGLTGVITDVKTEIDTIKHDVEVLKTKMDAGVASVKSA